MITSPSLLRAISLWLAIFIFLPEVCSSYHQTADPDFPFIKPVAIVKGGKVILKPVTVAETLSQHLTFKWSESTGNPARVTIHLSKDGTANAEIPDIKGDCYFTLIAGKESKTEKLETFVTRNEKG
jgi:hypothetical protein